MRARWILLIAATLLNSARGDTPKTAELDAGLNRLSLDSTAIYRVRDLQLNRGDVKFFLNDGILSFFAPLDGRILGAVFMADNVEGGDGEVLMLPPLRSERASLAAYVQHPNLDEHLRAAIFLFSDETASELKGQIASSSAKPVPGLFEDLNTQFGSAIRNLSGGIDLRLLQSLVDAHDPRDGLFYATLFGRNLPSFTIFHDPHLLEPITIGQGVASGGSGDAFQVWATYRPRRAKAFVPPANRFSNYKIETRIRADLTLDARAEFDYESEQSDGRAFRFELSDRLKVLDGTIDGAATEVFQRSTIPSADTATGGSFLLIADATIQPGKHHIVVHYGGGVIRQTGSGTYFVDDRTSWFPYSSSLQSTFDLVFHCPDRLRLISTGELVSEEVKAGTRTVHRRSTAARPFAGFNLGRYAVQAHDGAQYRVEVYSDQEVGTPIADIPQQTDRILSFYTKLWGVEPLHTLAISPIDGYFGQGFPGLVYLADAAYLRPENRSPVLRTARFDTFLDRLLLPHEIAHQWWGNMVTSSTYRSGWLVEALANYSALQYLEATGGAASVRSILTQYRTDLLAHAPGGMVEATGPLDWGSRLLNSQNPAAWHSIVYGKGVWVLHMLRQRLGDKRFVEFERQLLAAFQKRTFTNEDLEEEAARLLPAGAFRDKDHDLKQFFDSWVFNTGVPRLNLRRDGREWSLEMGDVDEAFSVDVPVQCGIRIVEVRATKGETYLPKEARGSASCSLPDPSTFLYKN